MKGGFFAWVDHGDNVHFESILPLSCARSVPPCTSRSIPSVSSLAFVPFQTRHFSSFLPDGKVPIALRLAQLLKAIDEICGSWVDSIDAS